jgi:Fe-S cluster biogenesis protein NfuA
LHHVAAPGGENRVLGGEKMTDERQAETDGAAAEFGRQVAAVLEKIRPALLADGGDIELLAVIGRDAYVRLAGACLGCPSAQVTLRTGVEQFLRQEVPGFGQVISDTPEGGYGWRFDLMETF